MTETKRADIPPHTKWGIRISGIIILLISILVIKNCVGSIRYGISTDQAMQKQFYDLGYSHGMQRAQGHEKQPAPETGNLLLQKRYRQGFRDGWDSAQRDKKGQTLSEPPKTEP